MDLNLVRLCLPIPRAAEQLLTQALASNHAGFEQSLPYLCRRALATDPELVRRHQKPGLPFIFSIPSAGSMQCTLLGPAIAELSLIVATVASLAHLPPISPLTALDYQGQTVPLRPASAELPVLSLAQMLDLATPRYAGCRSIRVTVQTPLRLMAVGREQTRFDGSRFVRAALRRLSSLAAYYGVAADPELIIRLIGSSAALHLRDAQPLPPGRGWRGMLGSFSLAGESCQELGPWLEVGSLLHLGKGAAFGQGAFQVVPVS